MKAPQALALIVLLPALAGCAWFDPPPDPGNTVSPLIVQEAFVVPDLQLRIDSPYANLQVTGRTLAVPVRLNGTEAAAVFLGPQVGWRADAIYQVKERAPFPAPLYVQAPTGEWAPQRAAANWQPATSADLSAAGFADANALFLRASRMLPSNTSGPLPNVWYMNGTVTAKFEPGNVTIGVEEGPFVFQRDARGFVVIEGGTLLSWREAEGNLSGSNDVLFGATIHAQDRADLDLTWNATRVDVHIRTPPFRTSDLQVDDDRVTKAFRGGLPGIAEVSMLKYVSATVQDARVELRSQNVTVVLGP